MKNELEGKEFEQNYFDDLNRIIVDFFRDFYFKYRRSIKY